MKLITDKKPVTHHPVALVTADGRCLVEDLHEWEKWQVPHDLVCCCRSIKYVRGPVDHWVEVDSQESVWWAENLPDKWRNGTQRHTLGDVRGFDFDWEIEQAIYSMDDVRWFGSTSLFAALICIHMGYEKIILAGAPLDSQGHWYALPHENGPKWDGWDYQAWLDFAKQSDSYKVRSMSGYTAQIVGRATKEWASNQ